MGKVCLVNVVVPPPPIEVRPKAVDDLISRTGAPLVTKLNSAIEAIRDINEPVWFKCIEIWHVGTKKSLNVLAIQMDVAALYSKVSVGGRCWFCWQISRIGETYPN